MYRLIKTKAQSLPPTGGTLPLFCPVKLEPLPFELSGMYLCTGKAGVEMFSMQFQDFVLAVQLFGELWTGTLACSASYPAVYIELKHWVSDTTSLIWHNAERRTDLLEEALSQTALLPACILIQALTERNLRKRTCL